MLIVGGGLFAVSSLFPVAASLLEVDHIPRWVGIADVVIAGALVVLGMPIMSRKPTGFAAPVIETSFRIYRGLATTFPLLLAMFFVAGDNIRWSILLPGLAWRGWFLTTVLPAWLSAWQAGQRSVEG
jgi:hypothetical protein